MGRSKQIVRFYLFEVKDAFNKNAIPIKIKKTLLTDLESISSLHRSKFNFVRFLICMHQAKPKYKAPIIGMNISAIILLSLVMLTLG